MRFILMTGMHKEIGGRAKLIVAHLQNSLSNLAPAEDHMMLIKVRSVKPLGQYRLAIEFSNGMIGERDFSFIIGEKTGPMAEPSKDKNYFARVFIEDGVMTWPNGYDWDPIALHDEMKAAGELRPVGDAMK
jgi:hypothetical protein